MSNPVIPNDIQNMYILDMEEIESIQKGNKMKQKIYATSVTTLPNFGPYLETGVLVTDFRKGACIATIYIGKILNFQNDLTLVLRHIDHTYSGKPNNYDRDKTLAEAIQVIPGTISGLEELVYLSEFNATIAEFLATYELCIPEENKNTDYQCDTHEITLPGYTEIACRNHVSFTECEGNSMYKWLNPYIGLSDTGLKFEYYNKTCITQIELKGTFDTWLLQIATGIIDGKTPNKQQIDMLEDAFKEQYHSDLHYINLDRMYVPANVNDDIIAATYNKRLWLGDKDEISLMDKAYFIYAMYKTQHYVPAEAKHNILSKIDPKDILNGKRKLCYSSNKMDIVIDNGYICLYNNKTQKRYQAKLKVVTKNNKPKVEYDIHRAKVKDDT